MHHTHPFLYLDGLCCYLLPVIWEPFILIGQGQGDFAGDKSLLWIVLPEEVVAEVSK